MGTDQRFSLRWNNYQSHLVTAFESLLEEKDFVDVTLGVEGRKLPAHKMLLSACSPYFRELLKGNPCQHPIIILRDIKYDDLFSLLQFMYNGEVNVAQDQLNSFLKSAESLKIRGLTDGEGGGAGDTSQPPAPSPPPAPRDLQPPPAKRKRPYPESPSPSPAPKRIPQPTPPPQATTATTRVAEPVKQEVIELGDEQYDEEQGAYDGEDGGGGGDGYPGGAAYQEEGAMVPHGGGEEGMEAGEGAQGDWYPDASKTGYQCEDCFKWLPSKNALTKHIPLHQGKTKCLHCDITFSTVSNLNKHMRKHHSEAFQLDY